MNNGSYGGVIKKVRKFLKWQKLENNFVKYSRFGNDRYERLGLGQGVWVLQGRPKFELKTKTNFEKIISQEKDILIKILKE